MTSLPERGEAPPSDPLSKEGTAAAAASSSNCDRKEGAAAAAASSSNSELKEGAAAAAASSSSSSEHNEDGSSKQQPKASILSCVFAPPFTVFEGQQDPTPASADGKSSSGSYGWSRILRRIVGSTSMWRLLGCAKVLTSSDVWFLGKCYREPPEESSSGGSDSQSGHAAFLEDFSSRIWITYRKGWAFAGLRSSGDYTYFIHTYLTCCLSQDLM
jgi:cysteine protease ATG4